MENLITGAEALMRSLEHQGVKTIFGYPGGSIMPVFDALYDHRKNLNLHMRHKAMRVCRVRWAYAWLPAVRAQRTPLQVLRMP